MHWYFWKNYLQCARRTRCRRFCKRTNKSETNRLVAGIVRIYFLACFGECFNLVSKFASGDNCEAQQRHPPHWENASLTGNCGKQCVRILQILQFGNVRAHVCVRRTLGMAQVGRFKTNEVTLLYRYRPSRHKSFGARAHGTTFVCTTLLDRMYERLRNCGTHGIVARPHPKKAGSLVARFLNTANLDTGDWKGTRRGLCSRRIFEMGTRC